MKDARPKRPTQLLSRVSNKFIDFIAGGYFVFFIRFTNNCC